jgi:hypothetical protein
LDTYADAPPSQEMQGSYNASAYKTDILTIIHTTGVFKRRVRKCMCCKSAATPPPLHIQLFQSRLFAATTSLPRTAATLSALDDYHIEVVECHTTVSSYFQKLRRSTNQAFYFDIPVSFELDTNTTVLMIISG